MRGIKPRFFFKPIGSVGAIEYYRAILPLRALQAQGLVDASYEKVDNTGPTNLPHLVQKMASSDFVLFLNRPFALASMYVRDLKALKPAGTRPYGDIKYPPSIVWSIDDNYHWVHPANPSFQYNGYRLLDGTEIKNNESVLIPTADGHHEVMWQGGRVYNGDPFLPEKNKADLAEMDQFIKTNALQVSFSSPRLEEFYRKELRYPSTYFLPNCVEFDDYLPLMDSKFVRNSPAVRVLWQGGASHFMDLYPLKASLIRMVRQMPEIEMIVWGQLYTWITRELPDDNFRYLPWVSYDAYKPLLSCLDYDFALAPLLPDKFNEGKSAIKVYESAAVGKPTLAANVPPYSDEFVDGETAMLYDPRNSKDFEAKFEALARDPELRDRIAKRAAEWCREYRNAKVESRKWYEQLQALRGPNWSPNPGVKELLGVK